MNRLERIKNLNEVLLKAIETAQASMWTALPGTIVSYNNLEQTCSVQPTIQLLQYFRTDPPEGTVPGYDKVTRSAPIDLPVLVDVPILFPAGGGYTITFPVAVGDEVLVVFSSRCIDAWWALGTTPEQKAQPQMDMRTHDLSDGIAILGLRNKTRMLSPAPVASSLQLRSDDGQAKIEIAAGHVINITGATVNVTANSINLKNAGAALKKLVNETFLTFFNTHVHNDPVSGVTSAPTVAATAAAHATSVTKAE